MHRVFKTQIKLRIHGDATAMTTTPKIYAEYDQDSVIVYQAFKDKIANFAIVDQKFSRGFGLNRMSWIKPSFCWLLKRSNYCQKRRQTRLLRIKIKREFFDLVLAVGHTTVQPEFASDPTKSETGFADSRTRRWRVQLDRSNALIQFDPDYDVYGRPLTRRAIQIGLARINQQNSERKALV